MQDVPVNDLIEALAVELKKIKDINPPEWAIYVKTGVHRERPPIREDWWHVRAAAVLRSVDRLGPIGVEKLRTKYGGKKNRGHKPERFFKGSGNILRKILQQLEKAGLVKKQEKDIHKGRKITPAGKKLITNALKEAKKSYSKRQAEKKEEVIAEKPAAKPQPEQKPDAQKQEKKPEQKAEDKKEAPQKTEEPKPEAKAEEAKPEPKPAEKVPTAHELAEKKKNE